MSETFFPNSKEVEIAGEKFKITPYVLRKRTQVIRIIADILVSLSKKNPSVTKEQLLSDPELRTSMILALIDAAGDKLIDIYEITLGKDREWLLDKVEIKNEIEIISAIWEVNDIPFLFSQVKGMAKSLQLQKTA